MYKYEALVEKHFQVGGRSGEEWMVRCISHRDSTASMQINVEKGLWLCFTCGAKGNAKALLRELGLQWSEPEVDVADLRARIDALRTPDAKVQTILPESYLRRFQIPTRAWRDRGITPATVAAFDLGYDMMGDYLTIPIRDINGALLGVIKRYMGDDVPGNQRYKYPLGFKRSQNLFGSWLVEHDPDAHTVVLCEGSLDAVKLWQANHPALAVYGSSISESQVRLLRRLGVVRVVLFFDDDPAGEKAANSCLGEHLHMSRGRKVKEYRPVTDLRRSFVVEKVTYPKAHKGSDPGALDAQTIGLMLQEARRIP